MSDDKDLLSRISQIAGQINLRKGHASSGPNPSYKQARAWSKPTHSIQRSAFPGVPSQTVYMRPRGRAGKISVPAHRHRSLILNRTSNSTDDAIKDPTPSFASNAGAATALDSPDNPTGPTTGWITKRDRHMQLINSAVYDQETETRKRAIEHTRRQKAFERDSQEKSKIQRHLQTLSPSTHYESSSSTSDPGLSAYTLSIDGLSFQVSNDGSKLSRVFNDFDKSRSTPKRTLVGGVTFIRSKNGNLYRLGLVRVKRHVIYPSINQTNGLWHPENDRRRIWTLMARVTRRNDGVKRIPELCKCFTSTGSCAKGPACRYIHDPAKVAMCPTFLQTGNCPAGESCDLSHEPTPERVPTCLHFLRGRCSNSICRYAHVRVNPSALVCRDFSTLGYCSRGATCSGRHVHECPNWSNSGACHDKKCRLPHIDRAGQIRKQAANALESKRSGDGTNIPEDNIDDISSEEDEENGSDDEDVDSDGMEDGIMPRPQTGEQSGLFQQNDFVHL